MVFLEMHRRNLALFFGKAGSGAGSGATASGSQRPAENPHIILVERLHLAKEASPSRAKEKID